MLEKLFSIVLGILGIVTTTVYSPIQPASTTQKATPAASEKIVNEKTNTPASKLVATTSTVKGQTKKPPVKVPPKAAAPKPAEAPRSATTTSPDASVGTPNPTAGIGAPVDWSAINQKARSAIVNILCTSQSGGSFEPLSGSGVIIDSRGIILTNAHVAQYLLLQDYRTKNFLTCVARTGSPATPAYTLKILYISQEWLKANYKNITSQHPTGTGENDFALLQIAGSTNPDLKLQTSFPALSIDGNEDNIKTGESVVLAGYPAGFLGGITIQRDLHLVSSIINIGRLFTFKTGTLDTFSLGGSPVAQQGSSGGGVVSSLGKLLGIIVTSTDAKDTADRDLEAISVAHINRSLSSETSLTIDSLLASNFENFSAKFNAETLPSLKKLLLDELDSKNR